MLEQSETDFKNLCKKEEDMEQAHSQYDEVNEIELSNDKVENSKVPIE